MITLPLFPLNMVLFPSMPLKLHIFEERYKTMINECIEQQKPFGVVLIESGEEALGPVAQPHMIGTTAEIIDFQRLPFGRMNITAVGKDRFRVNSLHNDRPFLSGIVDMLPFIDDDNRLIKQTEQQLRGLLTRYLTTLSEVGFQFDESQMPNQPQSLAHLAAIVLQTDVSQKQDILESLTTSQLLRKLVSIYKREVALLDVMMSPPKLVTDNDSPFSAN